MGHNKGDASYSKIVRGDMSIEAYRDSNGRLDGGLLPALLVTNLTTKRSTRSWYQSGKLGRDFGLPAIESDNKLVWYSAGVMVLEYYVEEKRFNGTLNLKNWLNAQTKGLVARVPEVEVESSGPIIKTYTTRNGKRELHSLKNWPSVLNVGQCIRMWHEYGIPKRPQNQPTTITKEHLVFSDGYKTTNTVTLH